MWRNFHLQILAATFGVLRTSGYNAPAQRLRYRYRFDACCTRFLANVNSLNEGDTLDAIEKDKADETINEHPQFIWSARTISCWRPTMSDVILISWGKPARQKGTGSRGVPHRLNSEERAVFDRSRLRGYLEVLGSGWRSTRRDSPLINSWRSWCDARGRVCLILHKGNGNPIEGDDIVVDLSPLRHPELFGQIGRDVSTWMELNNHGHCSNRSEMTNPLQDERLTELQDMIDYPTHVSTDNIESPWETRPIYHLPAYIIRWTGYNRSKAKQVLRVLSEAFDTRDVTASSGGPSKKPIHVKPGKSRRSGGYGI